MRKEFIVPAAVMQPPKEIQWAEVGEEIEQGVDQAGEISGRRVVSM